MCNIHMSLYVRPRYLPPFNFNLM